MPEIENAMAASSSSGALFGKYEVGRLLGCGAFAKVYHARDLRSGQSVAIKVINKKRIVGSTSSAANLVANTKREISIMRRLSHPHIVRLHEVLATKTKIYFVMELVKGGELFARVSKGRFTEDLGRRYFRQLISAVGYCHSRGVFHRDLKPENLLLADDGNLKVTDFGLSAVTESIRSDGLLHTLCGTPAYVAPEILAKRGYDGAKIDVWSCGVILFVLIAGYLPFNDPNLMNMYRKIYKGEYRCPKWMSGELRAFLARLLDINPKTRITVDGILHDPWFKKGLTVEIKFYHEEEVDDYTKLLEGSSSSSSGGGGNCNSEGDLAGKSLNAFDLISFSSGLNLSGLFHSDNEPVQDMERFVARDEPDRLVERVMEVAGSAGLRARRRKEWVVQVDGLNGTLSMVVEVYRLTEELAVVEARRMGGDPACFTDVWRNQVRPELDRVGGPEPAGQVAGDD